MHPQICFMEEDFFYLCLFPRRKSNLYQIMKILFIIFFSMHKLYLWEFDDPLYPWYMHYGICKEPLLSFALEFFVIIHLYRYSIYIFGIMYVIVIHILHSRANIQINMRICGRGTHECD